MTETAVVPRKQGMNFDAIVIRDGKSVIRNIKSKVTLSVKDGTLVKMGNMKEKDEDGNEHQLFIASATGIREEAQMSGVMPMQPKSIIVNNREQPNNYEDPETGKVYSESYAIGYTKLGQLTAVKRMMIYDPHLANMQDLISKATIKWNVNAFKMAPIRRDSDGHLIPPKDCDEWVGYPIDEAMSIWVDCSNKDVFKWQREMLNKRDKAIRTCQTFAERNALAAHPAMPKQRKFHKGEVTIPTISWFASEGSMRFGNELLEMDPEKLLAIDGVEVESKTVDLNEEIDHEERLAGDEVIDVEDVTEEEVPPEEEQDQGEQPEKKAAKREEKPAAKPTEKSTVKNGFKRPECTAEIQAIILKGSIPDKKRKEANKLVGFDPESTKLAELEDSQLEQLLSLYRAAVN